jgi:Big-like domain-containing protein
MRLIRGCAALAVLFSSATLATCVFPTERDSSVHVSVTHLRILIRGRDTTAKATAWQMIAPGDSQRIPNVTFVWSSSNTAVATVDNAGHVVGVNSGTVVIRAAAANFDKGSAAGNDTLRVSAPLEIDSVRPKTVRYGEKLTIYGVGVDSIFSASLAGAALIHVPFTDTVFKVGTARTRFWVPPPATTDSLFYLGISGGLGVFGFLHGDTTRVLERDIYEPNDTIPSAIDLDGARPFPITNTLLDSLLFFNPALAFETLKRGQTTGVDWYHFTQAKTRDVTIFLTAPQIAGTFSTFLTDSLGWNGTAKTYFIGHDAWTFGPSSHACHGARFSPSEQVADSTIVAFKNLPAGALDGIALYGTPGRYGLGVIAGYQSELPADAHEDDNSCNAADLRGTVPAPFRDTLTIENAHDVDWIRFHYTSGGLGTSAQVRLHAFPGVHPDSLKDLDLYVLKIPQPGDTVVQLLAADTAAGSDANLTPSLATADYYLAVVDFAGTATTYEVCVGTVPLLGGGFCNTAFPAPPAAASTKRPSRVKRQLSPLPFVPSRR